MWLQLLTIYDIFNDDNSPKTIFSSYTTKTRMVDPRWQIHDVIMMSSLLLMSY